MKTETIHTPSVTNLKPFGKDGFTWHADNLIGDISEYRTNEAGQGLWCAGRQVSGTCQFSLTAKTESGIRRQIKRQMSL